jgi:NTP pyrophosphatase (non-canonical NTP hydrolase)
MPLNYTHLILSRIANERHRQEDMAGTVFPWTCANLHVDNASKLAVLTEEVGEVARAILELDVYHTVRSSSDLQKELIQVAAVACAHAEAIEAEMQTLNHL